MRLILATGSDLNYLSKMRPYLKSIESNSNFDKNILVFVGEDEIQLPFKNIDIVNLPVGRIQSLNSNKCVQHGDFLNSPAFDSMTEDDDVIIYTDGDIIIQRNLSEDEIKFYNSFKDGDVYVGYNASPTDTLADEATRLGKTGAVSPYVNIGVWGTTKVYNTGVLAMNKKTWVKLLERYNTLYPHVTINITQVLLGLLRTKMETFTLIIKKFYSNISGNDTSIIRSFFTLKTIT